MSTYQHHEDLAIQLWFAASKTQSLSTYLQACQEHRKALQLGPGVDYIRSNCGWFIEPRTDFTVQKAPRYRDCKISVLVVGFSRPEGAMRAAISAQLMASNPELVEVLVCTDESDPLKDRYTALPDLKTFVVQDRRTSAKWNYLYKQSTGDILVLVCDDVVFTTTGWDEYLRKRWPEDGLAVGNPTAPVLLEFPVISRKMADTLGYAAYPEITHGGLDTFWAHVGDALGRYYLFSDVCRVEHRHYETHTIHNRQQRYASKEEFSPQELRQLALTEAQKLK